jgi:hypothetical protein
MIVLYETRNIQECENIDCGLLGCNHSFYFCFHSAKLSVSVHIVYNGRVYDELYFVNNLEGNGSSLMGILYRHLPGEAGESIPGESPLRILGFSTKIPAGHILNTSLQHYRYIFLLGL